MTDAPQAAGASSSGDGAKPFLEGWVASDINTLVLERHSANLLRALGVDIKELNVFELHKEAWLTDSPALVICGNIQPPIDHFDYLDVLLQRYAGWRVSAADRRAFYEAMAFEAICGALPLATVVTVTRESDPFRAGKTPVFVAPMGHVPGYVPKECNWEPSAELHNVRGGGKNRVRVRHHGPFTPGDFVNENGSFNLVAMCTAASAMGMKVVFLGEWDGTLSLGCATGVLYDKAVQERNIKYELQVGRNVQVRCLGGELGSYEAFWAHARCVRARQLMDEQMRAESPVWPEFESRHAFQPHCNLNAACMWHFATALVDVVSGSRG